MLFVVFVNVIVDVVVSVLKTQQISWQIRKETYRVVVDMVIGVGMGVIVGLLVFVESFVGMEVVVLVDMAQAGRLYWTGLEEIFFYLLLDVLTTLCSKFRLMKLLLFLRRRFICFWFLDIRNGLSFCCLLQNVSCFVGLLFLLAITDPLGDTFLENFTFLQLRWRLFFRVSQHS